MSALIAIQRRKLLGDVFKILTFTKVEVLKDGYLERAIFSKLQRTKRAAAVGGGISCWQDCLKRGSNKPEHRSKSEESHDFHVDRTDVAHRETVRSINTHALPGPRAPLRALRRHHLLCLMSIPTHGESWAPLPKGSDEEPCDATPEGWRRISRPLGGG